MKKLALMGILISLSVTGCSPAGLSADRLTAFELEEPALTSIFPAGYLIDQTDSDMGFGNIPCNIHEVLEDQGAQFRLSTTFDSRLSIDDPTYYRVELMRLDSEIDFKDLNSALETHLDTCGYLPHSTTVGAVNNFSSESAKISRRSLESLNLPKENVFQFDYEYSSLVFNSETMYTDGTREEAQVLVVHSQNSALVIAVKGRNYETNSAEFPYLEELITTALAGFTE